LGAGSKELGSVSTSKATEGKNDAKQFGDPSISSQMIGDLVLR
jgi:hypothetical protein